MKNKEIDEIYNHVQNLKKKCSINPIPENFLKKNDVDNTSEISEKEDMVSKLEELQIPKINSDQNIINEKYDFRDSEITTFIKNKSSKLSDHSEVTCDVCKNTIILGKNLSGLVVSDEFFACEECCQNLSKEDLMKWTKSKMISVKDVRPIGLWVIQQQNLNTKTKL